ncbi:Cas10/Cmr2 second palm domain-containing protein [Streptosporangium saharense]|uniref:Cas10/Cmr2 second palm domain-containing protein n=1 Tax=Streptosporangium saharense TaxID=1706840 RepID=UPI0036B7130A
MHLVMIGTAGLQRYIFASGKRQQIVGASDLIARVDGEWADRALAQVFPGFDRDGWRIGTHDAELLVAGAGGVTVLVRDRQAGERLVTRLELLALEFAPGLDVCGVVVDYEEGSLASAVQEARRKLPTVRERRPGPSARFPRLPIVADCASDGLPAEGLHSEGEGEAARPESAVSRAKRVSHPGALSRMSAIAGTDRATMNEIVDHLGFRTEWVAVIHADGNGLGEVFGGLDGLGAADASLPPGERDRRHAERLGALSRGVDGCAKRAFAAALRLTARELASGEAVRVLPLIIGGDDLTVVCEGEVALPFARHYLERFERMTKEDPLLRPVLARLDRDGLGAAAGVAIVKRNYPFHFAYELAEALTKEAKGVKSWGSALSFVSLFESSAPDLKRIRASVALSGGGGRSASPYLVGVGSGDARARGRRWQDVLEGVAALRRRDPASGEVLLPGGLVHELREGMCLGEEVAASRFELARRRFTGNAARTGALLALGQDGDLTWTDRTGPEERSVTRLLDVMAARPFVPEGPWRSEGGDA